MGLPKNRKISIDCISAVVLLMGSVAAASRALNVDPGTIHRWVTGRRICSGGSLIGARAIMKHPEDYAHHKHPARVEGGALK